MGWRVCESDRSTNVQCSGFCVGDDAVGVQWMDITGTLQLFASHSEFVKKVAQLHNAHW